MRHLLTVTVAAAVALASAGMAEAQDYPTRLGDLGIEGSSPDQQSPEALRAFQKTESERWWPIIKAGNLKGG
jgi:hypothetical protein